MKACRTSSTTAVNLFGTDSKPGDRAKLKAFLYGNARKSNKIFQCYKQASEQSRHRLELESTQEIRFTALSSASGKVLKLYEVVLDSLDDIS